MAEKAKSIGYEYVGISDHAGKLPIANSMNERQILKQSKEIKKLRVPGIKILHGAEVNILDDGRIDVHNRVLRELDFVLASIHAKFSLPKRQMTDRVIRAMDNPYVNIIGHPTGRKVLKKPGFELDWPRIFEASKRTNTYLEINAYPERLDLSDVDAMKALRSDCKLIVNTDAHSASQLDYMRLGVGVARRAWARKSDIINTLTLPKFLKVLKK
jgi:DNA polymerase (family 10)